MPGKAELTSKSFKSVSERSDSIIGWSDSISLGSCCTQKVLRSLFIGSNSMFSISSTAGLWGFMPDGQVLQLDNGASCQVVWAMCLEVQVPCLGCQVPQCTIVPWYRLHGCSSWNASFHVWKARFHAERTEFMPVGVEALCGRHVPWLHATHHA